MKSRTKQSRYLTVPTKSFLSHGQQWTKGSGRYVMTQTDIWVSYFAYEFIVIVFKTLVAIWPPDATSGLGKFYWTVQFGTLSQKPEYHHLIGKDLVIEFLTYAHCVVLNTTASTYCKVELCIQCPKSFVLMCKMYGRVFMHLYSESVSFMCLCFLLWHKLYLV